jgi:hypothetical protein
MVSEGDTAPAFTATVGTSDHEPFDLADLGLHGIANRAVFVLDADGGVVYAWEADDPTTEPDYEAVLDAVESA